MVRLAFRHKLAVLVLSLALLTPWSAQARPLPGPLAEPLADVASRFAEWFTTLFGDVGCSWDPGGLCRDTNGSQPAPPDDRDVGCSLDPGGGCHG